MKKIDIVILSNGPGELATWVRPVVQQLRQQANIDMRISVILSPCPHATGKEAAIALSYPEIDRVQPAEYFWRFLLWGKTAENWHWYPQGIVLFLGGDQFFTVAVGKRLGYRTVIYAEWDARWWRWIDKFGVMKPEVAAEVPPKYADKFTVVGDLMAEVNSVISYQLSVISTSSLKRGGFKPRFSVSSNLDLPTTEENVVEYIGLLPGSKPTKLSLGVPLTLAIAQHLHKIRPQTRFIIPVAPTLELSTLASFADSRKNPAVQKMGGVEAKLLMPPDCEMENPKLVTSTGLEVELITRTPAYDLLSQCRLCLTTVGANTAELGSLAIPMIVLLPTQQLDIMRAWDGLPGLLANLPGVGAAFAAGINWLVLRKGQLFAWPNIWAKQEIVPELVGKLTPETVAELVLDFLSHPEKLAEMRDRLRSVRGQPGAAQKLAEIVLSLL
ncbi:MAG: lipid-A-disaccharide synthase [Okeania sp. SIO2G4]|uniref:lipid-A-disaccharide synthase n=1 Tax=unclassified Okeania TaxID=2634635 RepID=UPI0013B84950|nr:MULTISPECIES: lipid-A-disaccharide synthase [unclassified Okeania]NEP70854.1 lipid-A-disaccharide synthase [Okeania sp. SIO2G5]NEP92367.1 lipid-A-disaccharide synthase [Okeania sp. SIO2F5]NEQ89905.1 lipid-A-disaccharide synthase [Okeania sp. SIO2G4]